MAEVILNKNNFEMEVINSNIPVLIDFWATWCGPCQMLAPVIEDIAKEYEGKVKVCKVNVDEEGELAAQFGVNAIPTLVVIKEGKQIGTSVGYQSKEQIVKMFL